MPDRVDANQGQIVEIARDMGASVADTHMVKDGFPDLVVGWRGHNLLVEVKSPVGRMTKDQLVWQDNWRGPVHIVRSAAEMVELLSAICCKCGERAEWREGYYRCPRCGETW